MEIKSHIGSQTNGHALPLRVVFASLKTSPPQPELVSLTNALRDDEWDEVARLAIDRHRIGPRVWSRLKALTGTTIPATVKQRFEAGAQWTAFRALAIKAETARVANALNQISIEPVLLKGWALEEDLFGSIAKRVMSDLDMMVSTRELPATATKLRDLGYTCELKNLFASKRRLDFYLRFEGDVTFHLDQPAIKLELHARPVQNARLLPVDCLEFDSKTVTVSGTTARYRSLKDHSAFLFLALHGYSHRWERAKWLCDIPPLQQRMTDDDWHQILSRAKALKVERAVGSALVLAHELLDAPIPPAARPLFEKATRQVGTNIALRHIIAPDIRKARLPLRHWLEAHAVYLSASRRPGAILRAATMRLVTPSDIANSTLPDRLLFLHYPLSLLKWPWRIARHFFVPDVKQNRH